MPSSRNDCSRPSRSASVIGPRNCPPQPALPIEHVRRRQRRSRVAAEEPFHYRRAGQKLRICDAEIAEHRAHRIQVRQLHADPGKIDFGAVAPGQRHELRQLHVARRTPGSPEIDHRRPAGRRQRPGTALQTRCVNRGRRGADRLGPRAVRPAAEHLDPDIPLTLLDVQQMVRRQVGPHVARARRPVHGEAIDPPGSAEAEMQIERHLGLEPLGDPHVVPAIHARRRHRYHGPQRRRRGAHGG